MSRPPPAPRPPLISDDFSALNTLVAGANGTSERQSLFYLLIGLAGGLVVTLLLLVLACIEKLPVSCASSLTILIGSGVVCVDTVFAYLAWQRVNELITTQTDTMLQSEDMQQMRRIAYLALGSAAAPIGFYLVAFCHVLMRWNSAVDWAELKKPPYFLLAILVILSTCNAELLQLIPWRERYLSGFPTTTTVSLTVLGCIVGDALQLGVQTYFIVTLAGDNALDGSGEEQQRILIFALGISLLCSILAVASLWSRGLRKLVILGCSRKAPPPQGDGAFWVGARPPTRAPPTRTAFVGIVPDLSKPATPPGFKASMQGPPSPLGLSVDLPPALVRARSGGARSPNRLPPSMAEGGGLPPPVLSSRAETAKRVAAAARRKEEEAALLKAAEEAAARVGISPSQPLDARRSALTQRLEPLAPRGDAMRWLSQLEDQGASELISPRSRPHSPMASEHASGVAVDGEQIVAPVARRPAPEQPRNWSDMLWYSIAGIDPVTGERASDRASDVGSVGSEEQQLPPETEGPQSPGAMVRM